MRNRLSVLLASAVIITAAAQPALADGWHDHDIHHFQEHDFDHWRGGNWFHGVHEGRNGWWWMVDGSWYFYNAPVYPYPDPYTPPVVVTGPAPVATVGVPPTYAYYCHNPVGYYPYVPQCFGHWHRVVTGTTVVTTTAPPPTVIVQQPAAPTAIVAQPPAPAPEPAPYPVAKPPAAKEGQREADEHKLNDYAADFENIDVTGQQARGRLEALEKQVGAFHAALLKRNYNAIEVAKNSEDLERRIHEQMEHLGAPAEAAPGAPPAPGTPPSGWVAPPPPPQ